MNARDASARFADRAGQCAFILGVLLLTAWCGREERAPKYDPREALSGGGATTGLAPFPDFERAAANLPKAAKPRFYAGKALAEQPWVKAPASTTARDGLGPLYNSRSCFGCHVKGGKGHLPTDGMPLTHGFVRLSIPGEDERGGAVAEPSYGLQLQTRSTSLRHQLCARLAVASRSDDDNLGACDPAPSYDGPAPEGQVFVYDRERPFVYPDGRRVSLRQADVRIEQLGYGALHPETLMSLRVAPAIHGAGLIELVAQRAIDNLADPPDRDHDGISGRTNQVWDERNQRTVAGRFGYKANHASLESTVAEAFAGDLGISNPLVPRQPCTSAQPACARQPHGADEMGVEISDELLGLVVDFNRNLGVPKRRQPGRSDVMAGREHFYTLGCVKCHHPSFVTEPSMRHAHLGKQLIWPYSDFLLHDMGVGLADDRPDYAASGREWRTTPLWGLGLNAAISGVASYLHDGRARSIEEAILWHGGEADASKQRFTRLAKEARDQLLIFLGSL